MQPCVVAPRLRQALACSRLTRHRCVGEPIKYRRIAGLFEACDNQVCCRCARHVTRMRAERTLSEVRGLADENATARHCAKRRPA